MSDCGRPAQQMFLPVASQQVSNGAVDRGSRFKRRLWATLSAAEPKDLGETFAGAQCNSAPKDLSSSL